MLLKPRAHILILATAVIVVSGGALWSEAKSKVPKTTSSKTPVSVWVTRPDGGESCAPGSGQSLESGADELKKGKVRVLDSRKGNDGKLHAQMCGVPTGTTNAYLIPKDDLATAVAKGFVETK